MLTFDSLPFTWLVQSTSNQKRSISFTLSFSLLRYSLLADSSIEAPVPLPTFGQFRYKYQLPVEWKNLLNSQDIGNIRRAAGIRYCKILTETGRQPKLMLYGLESPIRAAVQMLEEVFTQHPPYYSAQSFEEARLKPDVYDPSDPECSWTEEQN